MSAHRSMVVEVITPTSLHGYGGHYTHPWLWMHYLFPWWRGLHRRARGLTQRLRPTNTLADAGINKTWELSSRPLSLFLRGDGVPLSPPAPTLLRSTLPLCTLLPFDILLSSDESILSPWGAAVARVPPPLISLSQR